MSVAGASVSGQCEVSTVQVPYNSWTDVDPRLAGQLDGDPKCQSDV